MKPWKDVKCFSVSILVFYRCFALFFILFIILIQILYGLEKRIMGTSWGQIVKEESKNYKGIGEYTKCQSQVFAYSSILLLAGNNNTNEWSKFSYFSYNLRFLFFSRKFSK